jgi:hypothetical protein
MLVVQSCRKLQVGRTMVVEQSSWVMAAATPNGAAGACPCAVLVCAARFRV